jgi:glyoxylase-like metal-dependent hydrolase (beta-lactamase superfamily II)
MQVIPGVYQITVRYSNFFLIVEESLTLIDTGFRGSVPGLFAFIRELGRSPEEIKLVVFSHNHIDHIGGFEQLKKLTGAQFASSEIDFATINDILPYPSGNQLGKLLKVPILSPIRKRLILTGENIDIKLKGGEVFPVLGGLRVIPTPGHTAGSISLYAPREKMLFVADALNRRHNILRLPLKTATTDLNQTVASIEAMAQLDVQILCFGHGKPIAENVKKRLKSLLEKIKN